MSSYLNIPGSNVRITDGTIVMLARFPGTRWVTHNGWYEYNGRNYYGWYFCSVPAQTVLPVNPQDLVGVSVVSDSDANSSPIYPSVNPGCPAPGPSPGPYPGPYPGDNFGPNPFPPMPPHPCRPVHFGERELAMLNSTVITVANMRDLNRIDTRDIPNGRVVIVNSVDGERKYFIWNDVDDRWDEFEFVEGYSELENKVEFIDGKVTTLEQFVTNPYKLPEITGSNTIIVSSDTGIADSLISIGDDSIDESEEIASATTVATEKAVVKLLKEKVEEIHQHIDEISPHWIEF